MFAKEVDLEKVNQEYEKNLFYVEYYKLLQSKYLIFSECYDKVYYTAKGKNFDYLIYDKTCDAQYRSLIKEYEDKYKNIKNEKDRIIY